MCSSYSEVVSGPVNGPEIKRFFKNKTVLVLQGSKVKNKVQVSFEYSMAQASDHVILLST